MTAPQNLLVATLVSNPSRPAVTEALVARAAKALGQETQQAVLARGIAADLFPPAGVDPALLDARLRTIIEDNPIDLVIQPRNQRRKKLLLADMDSTMIEQECIDELADFAGLKAEVSAITERAMNGEIAFEPALKERVALLKGLPLSVIDEILASRITFTPGGRALVQTVRANSGYTCLISGGFTLFTGPVAAAIGFDEDRSNQLVVAEGKLVGLVEDPIIGREAKLATLIELRGGLRLSQRETMAVGDGANDLAMLGEAGLGFAFHAKPNVAAAAHARIDHGDLSALLYAQGYKESEIVGSRS